MSRTSYPVAKLFSTSVLSALLVLLLTAFQSYHPSATSLNNLVSPTPRVLGSKVSSPSGELVAVTRIVDGDTVVISTGEKIRLIGINAPESVDPRKPVECFGLQSAQKISDLILHKNIRIEKDISQTDRYGRLLRYIWLDNELINVQLVALGYAYASRYPPDVKYQDLINQAQISAANSRLGLWGAGCHNK